MPRKRRQGPKSSPKPSAKQDVQPENCASPPGNSEPAPVQTAPLQVSFKEMAESILAVAGSAASPVQVYPKLAELMLNLMFVQRSLSLVAKSTENPNVRLKACIDLLEVMNNRAVDCSGVSIAHFKSKGLGLKAERHFQKHEVILRIPRDAIMTSQDAFESEIGDFLLRDPVCIAMPAISLALFLLHERFKGPRSKWASYIESLPQRYYGCLYISPPEFEMLKGSPIQEKVALDYRRMCRQYAIFTLEMERCTEAKNLLFCNQFTWEDFRWALSAVLSRNNPIPKDQISSAVGLVPVWDMGNHEFGDMTTDYDLESQCLVFHAMRDFAKGEQIFFHYGNRSNCDFFMYAGFAVDKNPFERFPLKLGISANDPLHQKRSQFLKKFCLDNPDAFYLARDESFLPKDVVAFARIFVMNENDLDQLDQWTSEQLFQPLDTSSELTRIDEEAVSFLRRRLELLLTAMRKPREAPSTETAVEALKLLDGQAGLLSAVLETLKS